MRRYQYSSRYQVNYKGLVAQKGDEIVGSRVMEGTGYFMNLEILNAHLSWWSRDGYGYFQSPEDKQANIHAPIIEFDLDSNGTPAYYGSEQHDFWRIKTK